MFRDVRSRLALFFFQSGIITEVIPDRQGMTAIVTWQHAADVAEADQAVVVPGGGPVNTNWYLASTLC